MSDSESIVRCNDAICHANNYRCNENALSPSRHQCTCRTNTIPLHSVSCGCRTLLNSHRRMNAYSVCKRRTKSNMQLDTVRPWSRVNRQNQLLHAVNAFESNLMHVNRTSLWRIRYVWPVHLAICHLPPPRMRCSRISTNFRQIKLLNVSVPVACWLHRNFVSEILIIICYCVPRESNTHFNVRFVIVRGQLTGTDFVSTNLILLQLECGARWTFIGIAFDSNNLRIFVPIKIWIKFYERMLATNLHWSVMRKTFSHHENKYQTNEQTIKRFDATNRSFLMFSLSHSCRLTCDASRFFSFFLSLLRKRTLRGSKCRRTSTIAIHSNARAIKLKASSDERIR